MKITRIFILILAIALAGCSGISLPVTGAQSPAATQTQAPAATQAQGTQVVQPVLPATAAPTDAQTIATPQASAAPAALPCTSPASLTPSLTEGPYFKAGSPERTNLIDSGVTGTKLTLTGTVYTTDCQPVAHALLEFWQANAQGQYDNSGYTLRGHQYTGANGRYTLETIIPGLYPGRTEHIHFKVQAPGGPVLTSQLFFPNQQENQSDQIFNPALVLPLKASADGSQTAVFDFVVSAK